MRKLALSLIVAFAFCVTAAVAQSGNGNMGGNTGAQGTRQTSPSAQPGTQTQPGQPSDPNMGPGNGAPSDQMGSANNSADHSKGEKKLKGCVQSQGGQYVLESKHGKSVMLTGQDVSAHVGHEVKVKGTWESGSASGMSSTSTTGASNAGSEKTFSVTNVEMVSETCKDNSSNNSNSGSGMGAGSAGSSTTGTGAGTGNTGAGNSGSTGSGTGNGTGSSTTPPQ